MCSHHRITQLQPLCVRNMFLLIRGCKAWLLLLNRYDAYVMPLVQIRAVAWMLWSVLTFALNILPAHLAIFQHPSIPVAVQSHLLSFSRFLLRHLRQQEAARQPFLPKYTISLHMQLQHSSMQDSCILQPLISHMCTSVNLSHHHFSNTQNAQ